MSFCTWAGKRLCGKLTGAKATLPGERGVDPQRSQWVRACTSAGVFSYVYGNTYEAGTCVDGTPKTIGTTDVGAASRCQSPDPAYAGVFDLVGNVSEWTDNCLFGDSGATTVCAALGSNGFEPPEDCYSVTYVDSPQNDIVADFGIRCCSDL